MPEINLKLRPKIFALKPGTRIVSNTFTMGDWEADDTPHGRLVLMQGYQKLTGTLANHEISDGKVIGTDVAFKAGGREYRGRMNGKTLELR